MIGKNGYYTWKGSILEKKKNGRETEKLSYCILLIRREKKGQAGYEGSVGESASMVPPLEGSLTDGTIWTIIKVIASDHFEVFESYTSLGFVFPRDLS